MFKEKMRKLSSLGSSGKYINNCWRDLLLHLGQSHIPRPVLVQTIFKYGKKFKNGSMPFLFPHQLFAALYHHYPGAWNKYILPSMEATQKFWSLASRTTLFDQHPLKHDRRKKEFCASA